MLIFNSYCFKPRKPSALHLQNAAGLLSNYSSVIIDAICLNKPVVEIIWDTISEDSSLNYHKIGISIPSKIEDLKHNVENILKNQSTIDHLSKKRIIFLKEQYGIPIDRNEMINILKKLI